jgi:hypothetical protein
MATYSKIPLSTTLTGSTIIVGQSAVPGTLIHQTQTLSANTDEIYLYATNTGSADSNLTIFWGASGTDNSLGLTTIQAYTGPTLISPGLILRGDNTNPSYIYATSSVLSGVSIVGYVNRITA